MFCWAGHARTSGEYNLIGRQILASAFELDEFPSFYKFHNVSQFAKLCDPILFYLFVHGNNDQTFWTRSDGNVSRSGECIVAGCPIQIVISRNNNSITKRTTPNKMVCLIRGTIRFTYQAT